MAGRHPATLPVYQPHPPAARGAAVDLANRSREIGYWGLLLLAFGLPFDVERSPLLWSNALTITNLTVLLLAAAVLAIVSTGGLAADALRGSPDAAGYFFRRRAPLVLVAAFLLSSAVSTIVARSSTQGVTWLLGVLTGGLLWLALPLWLEGDAEAKVNRLGAAIVAGAVVSCMVGFAEVLVGPAFDRHFFLFKFGPDAMGPFLRLSATFSSANVAAMYLELALPFAVAGLAGVFSRASGRWIAVIAWLAAIDVLLTALVLTYSRGALLGLLGAGIAMAWAGRGAWRRTMGWWRPAALVTANLALLLGIFASSTSSLELLRFSTQNDRTWYQASYVSAVPRTMAAGQVRMVPVTVENQSPLTWSASSSHAYGLSYHWLHPSWKVVRFANTITWLTADLRPGGRQTVRASVTAPRAPGSYLLVWDMVWQGTTWFGPRTGMYRASPVRVTQAGARSGPSGPSAGLPPPDITDLPTAPALARGQIWRVAARMIEQRPLFGVGPQGVRMNYAAFAPPDQAAPARKPPPHAHNLALEMLADWGVIGGGLFFGALALLWWPLLRRLGRGQVESAWELAVIGAAAALLTHGLVDYFLNKQAVFTFLWLLCGLAATMTRRASETSGPARGHGAKGFFTATRPRAVRVALELGRRTVGRVLHRVRSVQARSGGA